jgi:hypothetical protein
MRMSAERQRRNLWACAILTGAFWLVAAATAARAQNVPVTIKGKLFFGGFQARVRCEGVDGNTLSAGPTARYLVLVPSCALWVDATPNGYFKFDGKEEQLELGDPSNPVAVDALAFSGAMNVVIIGDSTTLGVLHGIAKGASTPLSERGAVAYVREVFGVSGSRFDSFVGEYKAKY